MCSVPPVVSISDVELVSVHKHLCDLHRDLVRFQSCCMSSSAVKDLSQLRRYQGRLLELESKNKVDGIWCGKLESGIIPAGQATMNELLDECHDIVDELQLQFDEEDSSTSESINPTCTSESVSTSASASASSLASSSTSTSTSASDTVGVVESDPRSSKSELDPSIESDQINDPDEPRASSTDPGFDEFAKPPAPAGSDPATSEISNESTISRKRDMDDA